jgi:hypothetical protein
MSGAWAQAPVPVYLSSTVATKDTVGSRMTFELKEAIRSSRSFRLVADDAYPRIALYIVTMEETEGLSTVASVVLTFDDLDMPLRGGYITSSVQVCGSDRVTSCARSMLASIDRAVERLQRNDRALHQRLVAPSPTPSAAPAGVPGSSPRQMGL